MLIKLKHARPAGKPFSLSEVQVGFANRYCKLALLEQAQLAMDRLAAPMRCPYQRSLR
ncbi:MAG TPA: hypothetical protein VFR90_09660 [Methylibium sp.]|uniref:hypothetical protein n=1 Tax=Methylibium sp. TaxID=2067992 RepID=UPI002DBD1340|nr:hypothetical protein [Methylibium sp.]HEU4459375.1 hypothetical protein [Methylibium sp.]